MSLGESNMEAFQHTALPTRVVFGFGSIDKVADELVSLGRRRAFVLSDPHHAMAAAARLMRGLGKVTNLLIGIRVVSSGVRFENSWTTPLTDAGRGNLSRADA